MNDLSLFAVFGIGPWQLAIVAFIVLLLFGNRLPSALRNLGRGAKEFKEGLQGNDDTQNQEAVS